MLPVAYNKAAFIRVRREPLVLRPRRAFRTSCAGNPEELTAVIKCTQASELRLCAACSQMQKCGLNIIPLASTLSRPTLGRPTLSRPTLSQSHKTNRPDPYPTSQTTRNNGRLDLSERPVFFFNNQMWRAARWLRTGYMPVTSQSAADHTAPRSACWCPIESSVDTGRSPSAQSQQTMRRPIPRPPTTPSEILCRI